MLKNDIERLNKILEDFYLLTGISASVFDKNGALISEYGLAGGAVNRDKKPVELFGNTLAFISFNIADNAGKEEKMSAAVRLLTACFSYGKFDTSLGQNPKSAEIRVKNYIENNLDADLSVRSLSEHFSFTHREIYALFKESFGTTPAEYVKNYRLAFSAKLLRETKLAVFKIAKRVGIDDYNYFSKLFRAHFKVSPGNYRKSGVT